MVLSLLSSKKYRQTNVGNVFLDATISEQHGYSARVTSFPVENGDIISDHIINEPETLNIVGIVSDTPLNIFTTFDRSVDSFNRLVRMLQNRQRLTVITGIKTYTDMVMTNLDVPRDFSSGQSLTFNITLQKILLDSTVRLSLDVNNPFSKANDKIPREIVADANNYPYIQADPITSLKDQSQSGVDIGIQSLLPIATSIATTIATGAQLIKAFL